MELSINESAEYNAVLRANLDKYVPDYDEHGCWTPEIGSPADIAMYAITDGRRVRAMLRRESKYHDESLERKYQKALMVHRKKKKRIQHMKKSVASKKRKRRR